MTRRRRFLPLGVVDRPTPTFEAGSRRGRGDIPTMSWLRTSARDGEAFDAEMVERLAVIGRGCRWSWPGRSIRKGMMVVLVVLGHIGSMPLVLLPGAERADVRPSGGAVLS